MKTKFHGRIRGPELRFDLQALWDPDGSSISDFHTPQETDATELFELWAADALRKHPNGIVPVTWWVLIDEDYYNIKYMPVQFDRSTGEPTRSFIDDYSWPVVEETGQRLVWAELPVVDLHWRSGCADRAGFIQDATNWKPSALTPYLYLPALQQAANPRAVWAASRPMKAVGT